MTWKSLTWMWIGCSSLLWLMNVHSSTLPRRGCSSGVLGKVLLSNSYTNAFGSWSLACSLLKPPDTTQLARDGRRDVLQVDERRCGAERLARDERHA